MEIREPGLTPEVRRAIDAARGAIAGKLSLETVINELTLPNSDGAALLESLLGRSLGGAQPRSERGTAEGPVIDETELVYLGGLEAKRVGDNDIGSVAIIVAILRHHAADPSTVARILRLPMRDAQDVCATVSDLIADDVEVHRPLRLPPLVAVQGLAKKADVGGSLLELICLEDRTTQAVLLWRVAGFEAPSMPILQFALAFRDGTTARAKTLSAAAHQDELRGASAIELESRRFADVSRVSGIVRFSGGLAHSEFDIRLD